MKAIETTAIFEGPDHLRLSQRLNPTVGEVRVIVLIPQAEDGLENEAIPNFHAAIGSLYRDFPDEEIRTSDAWMSELREGDRE